MSSSELFELEQDSFENGAYSGAVRAIAYLALYGFLDYELLARDDFIEELVTLTNPANGESQLLRDINYHIADLRKQQKKS